VFARGSARRVRVRNAWPGETLVLDVTPRWLEPAACAESYAWLVEAAEG
jgi:hypothetical protein